MSAEKKALKRFLVIYVLSTVFLIAVGEYFYFKLAYKNLLEKEKMELKSEVNDFLIRHPFILKEIAYKSLVMPKNLKVRIYFNSEEVYSNIKGNPKNYLKLKFNQVKRWGKIEIVAFKKIDFSSVWAIWRRLMVFNVFILLFLAVFSYFLGKAFIAPMKKTIENLESFIRDATHEMNTPISVILTNVETLGDTENKSLKRIKNAALRLNKIFEDLKFLRLNAKKRIKKIDLEAFLKERLKNFETAKENKKISLKLETEKCFVKFDEEDLNRLIDNVLSNAFKYAPASSEVFVFLKECRFCVENEGKITNPEKIKEKFYRENEIEGGFGLGLYIVDKICERYSLRLEIKNLQNKVSICVNF